MIKICGLTVPLDFNYETLSELAAQKLKINKQDIENIEISKRVTDCKNKEDVHFLMDIVVTVNINEDNIVPLKYNDSVSKEMNFTYVFHRHKHLKKRPVIVGFGPAGMFCALILAQAGERPLVLERGLDVDSRKLKVAEYFKSGKIDVDTNVQFGEGGAGTFSDGKLKIGAKDYRKMKVLREYIDSGAPSEILYLDKPHIGTDNLSKIVKNIRKKIISLGGEISFGSTAEKILFKDGKINGIGFKKNGEYREIETENVILSVGHSARDTYKQLLSQGIHIEQRPIAVGVRIEHPQKLINKIQFGKFKDSDVLGAASYKLVLHLENKRGVYSFCMCPGGQVVASASEENTIVTNGMSEFSRSGRNANSALLVTVSNRDFKSDDPLAGVEFQRKIERAAFIAGGGKSKAPTVRLEDFLNHRNSTAFGDVLPTYLPGTEFALPDDYLPSFVVDSLRASIKGLDDWMPGYNYPDAMLTGAETRSSSPVRIPRTESLEAFGVDGLYPCGEGAGFAGGIISSAVDGLRCAEMIIEKNKY